jgi:aryl-alcohol dehydrogenase-like predicted oxidoreductase
MSATGAVTGPKVPVRKLGRSDLEVSALGLGCNQLGRKVDRAGAARLLDACESAGVTLLDTADIYGGGGASESLLGEAITGRRDRFVVATKFGMAMSGVEGAPDAPRGSAEYIRWAVEGSLSRLRTDVIDLYQYHKPDGVTPLEETLGALHELVQEGLVRNLGCSNFDANLVEEAARIARDEGLTGFVSLQNEYSLLKRDLEADVASACERHGLGILPYFPLASGLLSGKYRRGEKGPAGARLTEGDKVADDATFDVIERLERYAAERGVSLLEVAIGGLAAQPAVASVIAGATKPEQIAANARAIRWTASAEDLRALDEVAPTPRG